jgi:chemotaxis protein methyltransferase CheR
VTRILTDEEYAATAAALVRLAGLVFDASRRAALSAVVHDRVESTGHASVFSYLSWVESPSGYVERQGLLDAVTIQETHFFRNLPQVDALRREVLPSLIARARSSSRPLTIWSAGCSTGEEPYTLAMLMLELFAQTAPVPVRIIGSDVAESALAVARQGVYAGRTIDLAEPGAAERWFDRVEAGFSVKREVRNLIEFQLHNLVTDQPPCDAGEIDLIVCRNVTIYFGRDTTRDLVSRFHRSLTEGGYLLLGHAETLWQVSDAFSLVPVGEAFVYRKDAQPSRTHRNQPRLTPTVTPAAGRSMPPKRGVRDVLRAPVRLPRRAPQPVQPTLPARVPSPLDDLATARQALAAGRYAEAASLAERATAAHPLLVDGYIVEGRALSNQGDDDGAIAALRKAVFLDPRAAHAHFLLATTLSRVGDPAGASLSFASAAETLPTSSPETLAELLDGRAVSDLVDLCRQLAAAVKPADEPPVGVAAQPTDQAGWRAP